MLHFGPRMACIHSHKVVTFFFPYVDMLFSSYFARHATSPGGQAFCFIVWSSYSFCIWAIFVFMLEYRKFYIMDIESLKGSTLMLV